MSYNITTLLNDISTITHGTKINKIPNIYGIINRAARQVIQDVDIKETVRVVSLPQVFNSIYDYPLAADVKGDRLIDIRLPVGRSPGDIFSQTYATTFDSEKSLNNKSSIHVQWNTGVKTIRIEAPFLNTPLSVCDTSTINGWSATTGAQSITLDTNNNPAGGGAIKFNLAAGSATGSVQISNLTALDMTSRENVDTEFYWVSLPKGSAVTSINFKWGSDYTSNYYNYTSTSNQQGNAFQDGWNLIAAPWSLATKVGSPVVTAYDSVQVTFNYDSTLQTGVKLCSITSNKGEILEAEYYSKFLFRDPITNVFQETILDSTEDNKIINLDTDSYNLLLNKTATFVAQSLQGSDAAYDATFFDAEYEKGLKKYKALNPSEAIKKRETYYGFRGKSYNKYAPGVWRR